MFIFPVNYLISLYFVYNFKINEMSIANKFSRKLILVKKMWTCKRLHQTANFTRTGVNQLSRLQKLILQLCRSDTCGDGTNIWHARSGSSAQVCSTDEQRQKIVVYDPT